MVGSSGLAHVASNTASNIGYTLNHEDQGEPNYYQESVGFSKTHRANNEVHADSRFRSMGGLSTAQQGAARQQVPGAANLIAQMPSPRGTNFIPGESVGFFKTNSANNESNIQSGSSAVQKSDTGQQTPGLCCGLGEAIAAFVKAPFTDTPTLNAGDSSVPTPRVNYPNFTPTPQVNYPNFTPTSQVNYPNFTPTPQVNYPNFAPTLQLKDYQNTEGVIGGAAQNGFSQGLSNQGNGRETGSRVPLPLQVIVVDDDPSQPSNVDYVIVEDDEGAATTSVSNGGASGGADILGGFSNGRESGNRLPRPPQVPNISVVEDIEGTNAGVAISGTGATTGAAVPSGEIPYNLYNLDVSQDGRQQGSYSGPQVVMVNGDPSQPMVVEDTPFREPIASFYEPTREQGGRAPLGFPTLGGSELAYTGTDFYPGDVQVSTDGAATYVPQGRDTVRQSYVPQGRESHIGDGGAIYIPASYNDPMYDSRKAVNVSTGGFATIPAGGGAPVPIIQNTEAYDAVFATDRLTSAPPAFAVRNPDQPEFYQPASEQNWVQASVQAVRDPQDFLSARMLGQPAEPPLPLF
eukprot:CAMPEP_0194272052 /NCGR_PEP_ID=MMETSP0169-20130528/5707_1 /TAXON_ID=218684 /ORGANISM="Corethron pennatum, Strain L29A3" /LENGTH=574 /DNA_ID=CAMNT_0039014601 /DNA_START=43 /DNA_END=1767 /DNA_ORIENTATION=+